MLGFTNFAVLAAIINTTVGFTFLHKDGLLAGHSSAKDTPVYDIAAASKTNLDSNRVKS